MPIIRNASFPGKVPLIVPEKRSRVPVDEVNKAALALADEIDRTCRDARVSRERFVRSLGYNHLYDRLKEGVKLRPETEQRVRLALRDLKKRGRL